MAGILFDHERECFRTTELMMRDADNVLIFKSACCLCGDDAIYSKRLSDSQDRFFVGGAESYQPRCEKCFNIP